MNKIEVLSKLLKTYYGVDISDLLASYTIRDIDDLIKVLKDEISIWGFNHG